MSTSTFDSTAPVVVGVDGSESSQVALEWALNEARLRNLPLEVVTTWEFPTDYGFVAWPEGLDLAGDAEKLQAEMLAAAIGSTAPPNVSTKVVEGHTARLLVERSATATLVVVGSRGHGGFSGLLLGSVSAHVASHAHCPVLIVHTGTTAATA